MSTHDAHSSFIKTPQQLIVVILLSFLVPITGIVLLVQLVTGRPGADPNALTPDAVAARIQPVGKVEFGGTTAAAGARGGEEIVKSVCSACHQAGVAGAPKIGDKAAWAPRIKTGMSALVQSVLKGKGAMPPKAGNASLTDEEVTRAVAFLANQAGANFKEPAAPKGKAAAPQKSAAAGADGKAVFDKVCTVCHTAGVAGAPKPGDKAAWAPRIKTGMDALFQSVVKGKGAMPPKAGNPALTDAEIRAAIEYMVSQSK